jgi:hypothetical protein
MKPEESILETSIPRRLINIFPYLLLIFSLIGFTVQLVLFHSLAFTLRSSVIFVPAALAGIFLLRKNKSGNEIDNHGRIIDTIRNHISFKNLVLINVLLLLWSIIIILSFDSRNITFFIVSSIIACIIILQILHDKTPRKCMLILFQICALSLSLAWSLTLNYSLYFGYTDTTSHMYYISTVLNSGHVYGLTLTYTNFPLYHIFISEGVLITGLGIGPALFLMMALAWLIGIVSAYLISSKLSNSTTIGLMIALLFAVSPQIIYYSSYTITRSLGFIFFMVILYLIFNKNENNRLIFTVLSIFMSWVLILTHHITIFYIIPLLLVIYLVQHLIVRDKGQDSGVSGTFLLLFSTTFVGYLFFVSYATTNSWITFYINPLMQDSGEINVASNGADFLIIIRSMYYIVFLFFALIGSWYILQRGRKNHSKECTIALASLLFTPLFIPGILDIIPGSGVLLTYRLPLLVSPFIVIILGYGILYFIAGNKSLVKSYVHPVIAIVSVIAIVATCSFFAMTGAAVDTPLPWNEGTSSDYFNVQETTAFANIQALGNHSQILYSDDYTVRNLYQLNGYDTKILLDANTTNLGNGYVVLRLGELESRGILQFGLNGDVVLYAYHIDPNDPQSNIILQLNQQERIYDNGVVQSFVIQKSHNG